MQVLLSCLFVLTFTGIFLIGRKQILGASLMIASFVGFLSIDITLLLLKAQIHDPTALKIIKFSLWLIPSAAMALLISFALLAQGLKKKVKRSDHSQASG
jgi:hypothetical protein